VIDETGATWLDLRDDSKKDATGPDGLTFAEIAGGHTVVLPDGTLHRRRDQVAPVSSITRSWASTNRALFGARGSGGCERKRGPEGQPS